MPLPTLQTNPGIVTPQPANAMMQAMTVKDKLDRTNIARQNADTNQKYLGLAGEKLELSKETLKFNKMQKSLEMGKQFIPSLTKEEYPKFKEWVKSIDGPIDLLPDEAPENWDEFRQQLYLGADNLTKANLAQYKAVMDQIKSDKKDKAAMERAKLAASSREKAALISKDKTDTEKAKKLKSLASDYFQQTGRGYSAERGTGQFIPDENKEAVARKAYDSAQIIAQTYVDAGGKWEDLGLEDPGKKVDELPEGLTEIDIDHNMKKYNKTREEVIVKFLEGKK